MRGDLFLRAALIALDEIGDPTQVRAVIEAARKKAAPLRAIPRPPGVVKLVTWHAERLAIYADEPARAYAQLHELCSTLFDPIVGTTRAAAPAPEIALTMTPAALVDALAPAPRVMARELAIASKLDSAFLVEDPRAERRVLGVRAISTQKLPRFAEPLAKLIATDPDPAVRAEALAVCLHLTKREPIAAALALHVDSAEAGARVAALDGLRELGLPLADARLLARLADPVAAVRAAAARSVVPTSRAGEAVVARLADADANVRDEALAAVVRSPALHRPTLVAPLVALVRRHGGDVRPAVYLLGKLHAVAVDEVTRVLHECVRGERSHVAHAAAIVLGQLRLPVPDVPVEARLLRAARELAAPDREAQLAGMFEARRLGEAARPLLPALRRLGDALATGSDDEARATLGQVRDVLAELGVPPAELPKPRAALSPWRGLTPRERELHGAYAIATVDIAATPEAAARTATGLWDRATGALLFVVEDAELFEVLHGHSEVGVVRCPDEGWTFERYVVPTGKRRTQLAIPEAFAKGWPSKLASAGNLVTVWCDDDEPYRFHIKLGSKQDRIVDDVPAPRKRERGSKLLPRRKAK